MQLHVGLACVEDALVVVVYGHGEDLFRLLLAYDIFVQVGLYLRRLRQPFLQKLRDLLRLLGLLAYHIVLVNNAHAQLHALVADIGAVAGYEPVHKRLRLAAEGAAY